MSIREGERMVGSLSLFFFGRSPRKRTNCEGTIFGIHNNDIVEAIINPNTVIPFPCMESVVLCIVDGRSLSLSLSPHSLLFVWCLSGFWAFKNVFFFF